MSIQTPLDIYSNTPIKNLEHIQNKALVIAPFEITKSGKLDPDLLLDTPGIININLYKKIVAGEDKEPTANQFKTIKYISELDSSNLISSFNIPVIFKYDKETGIRTIEKHLTQVSNNLDYIDFTIDVSNTDLSSETGSNGFYCVCQVQKISKPAATTTFTEVANDAFLFMIPSVECREIPELVEFDLLDSDNKVINIKKYDEDDNTNIEPSNVADFFGDNSTVACYLFDGNTKDETGFYNGTPTNITYTDGKFDKCAVFNGTSGKIDCTNIYGNCYSLNMWVYLNTQVDSTSDYNILGTWNINESGTWEAIALGSVSSMISGETLSIMFTDVGNTNIKFFYIKDIIPQGWNMLTFQWNIRSSNWEIYVNGTSKQIFNYGIPVFKPLNLILGSTPLNVHFYSGKMDNVRIFNRTLTQDEVTSLYKETKSITIQTQKDIDAANQGYRIYPVMKISDHINEETPTTPKYYLGTKYQRNLMEILSQGIKSKRTIFNLKDMYLVDDLCIQTLKKINILLKNNQMIKFSERLYNLATPLTPLREKLNAELILEYLSTPVSGSYSNDLEVTLKTSLIEDYNFTQEEIDNLNDNLNTFKSRARIALATPTIDNDKFRFDLPNTFIDGNKSKTEKKNLLVFGTDAGFNKFNLAGYSTPYSNISKRATSEILNVDDLVTGLTTLSSLEDISTIKDFQMSYGDKTQHILFENGNLYACRYVNPSDSSQYNRDGWGFTKQSFPLKLINTNVKSMYCGYMATFIIDNNNDVWALGGYSASGDLPYDIYGINKTNMYLQNWTKVFSSTPENTPKKIICNTYTTWLLMESGEVFCTGILYGYYTLDGSSTRYLKTWTSIATDVKDINCGGYHVVYTMQNGDVYVGDHDNQAGLTTQSNNTTTPNLKVLKILTNWIPTGQNITQIECTNENIYYLLSNGDVYGVGGNTAGQMLGNASNSTRYSTPIKIYTNVKRIIPQLLGLNSSGSVSMVELNTGEIKADGSTVDYKFGYYVDYNTSGVTNPITLYPKVDKIFLTERNVLAIINGKIFNSGYNCFSGTNLMNRTITEQFLDIAVSKNFRDILSNYKQQIPFTYIPLSTDIDDINIKPVFDNLTDITGFYKNNEIIIDIPNTL